MKTSRIVGGFAALLVLTLVILPSPSVAFGLFVVAAAMSFSAEQEARAVRDQQVHRDALARMDSTDKGVGELKKELEALTNRIVRLENRAGPQR